MRHLNLTQIKKLPIYQKIAINSWKDPVDPSIYAQCDLDYEQAQQLVEKLLKEKGLKVSPTYLISQAFALMYTCNTKLNVILRWGKLYERDSVSVSLLVSMSSQDKLDKRSGLSMTVIHKAEEKGLLELYQTAKDKIKKTMLKKDSVVKAQDKMFRKASNFTTRSLLSLSSFVLYTLNVRWKSLPYDPFGAVVISNVGQMGADSVFIPLISYSKSPVYVAIGELKPRAVVDKDRQVIVKDMLRLNVTVDHRYIEGRGLTTFLNMINHIFKDPERWLLPPPLEVKDEFIKSLNVKFL